MAPTAYVSFFSASMGAAAALLGLLFVAISIAPERTFAEDAPVERQVVATSAFTALVNAFFLSMGGAIPDITIAIVAVSVGCVSLFQTVMAGRRLLKDKSPSPLVSRRIGLVALGFVIYGVEFYYGARLLRSPGDTGAYTGLINPLFGIYGFALLRSWELMGARRRSLTATLASRIKAKRAETSPVQAAPSMGRVQ
jgi:hypothetical protein